MDANPKGFSTSQLYRDLFHSIPQDIKTKPMLFDQSRQSYGKIWLRPQELVPKNDPDTKREGRFLNLTLQLNEEPNDVVMNDLALALQYLPHVNEIRFVDLYAPRHQLESFIRSVSLAQKLRPLIRKLHARVKLRKLTEMAQNHNVAAPSATFLDLLFKPISHPVYDWSSARGPGEPSHPRLRQSSSTWPPTLTEQRLKTKTLSNRLFSIDYNISIPSYKAFRLMDFCRRASAIDGLSQSTSSASAFRASSLTSFLGQPMHDESSASNTRSRWRRWLRQTFRDDAWHAAMWVAVWYAMASICIHKNE